MKRVLAQLLPFLFLIVLVAFLSATNRNFSKPSNIGSILKFSSVIVIMGVGMTFVIVSAGIDLSVGSVVAFSSIIVAWCMQSGIPLLLSLPIGIATGSAWGLLNGALIVTLRLPPFVATLASMGMARGSAILLARKISGFGTSIEVTAEGFQYLGGGPSFIGLPIPAIVFLIGLLLARRQAEAPGATIVASAPAARKPGLSPLLALLAIGGLIALVLAFTQIGTILIPVPFPVVVMLLMVAIGHYVLNYTRLGRYTFAIGSNVEAARFSGIPVRRYTLMVYVLLGTLAGLAGMIEASINRGGHGTLGQGYELQVIAAVVIGGGSLSGGVGSILGTLSGALIMGVIRNGCILNRIDYEWQLVVISVLIVIAVALDTYRRRRSGTA